MIATAPGLSRIGQISMRALDLPRAVRFYRDVLGMKFLFEAPPRLAFFDCEGIRLMLSLPEGEFDYPGSVLYFVVEDIRSTYDGLKRRGVSFEGDPHLIAKLPDREVWMAFFRDSEGNMLALMSELRV